MIRKFFFGFTFFCIILTIFFIFLEFFEIVNWSLWVIFSPMIIYFIFLFLFCIMSILTLDSEDD